MSSWTGTLSMTSKASPAFSVSAFSSAMLSRLQASPTGTSYTAVTMACIPGIWRICSRVTLSSLPYQRKDNFMQGYLAFCTNFILYFST